MATRNKIRASLLEMWTRLTDYDEKERVHLNGEDNQYPAEIETALGNSPTGSRASNMLAKYIAGERIENDIIINEENEDKLSDVVRAVSVDVAQQYGCFIHVGYKINSEGDLVTCNPSVLDYKACRIDKKDDAGLGGKIYLKDWRVKNKKIRFGKSKKSDDKKWYYSFNKKQKVVISQIKNDAELNGVNVENVELEELVKNYRGQVYYLNLTPQYVYAVSLFDSVFNDLDTEYRIGLYTNSSWRTGFLGKLAVITQGIDEEDIDEVNTNIKNWLGAEDASTVFRIDVEHTENIKEVLHIEQIKSQYDENQSKETRKNVRLNILGAANNIPEQLIFNSGGIFASGGEAYKELKEFYSEQTSFERSKVESTMAKLGFPCKIVALGEDDKKETKEK